MVGQMLARALASAVRSIAIASVTLISLAGSASAIERYDLERMTCSQITEALSRDGRAVLQRSSKNVQQMKIFDVYVGSPMACPAPLLPQKKAVLAKDASCDVFQCVPLIRSWSRVPRGPMPKSF